MTFVVTETCIKCKYMDCVEVCPVDCLHEGPNFLAIDPEECIDCTLCEPECTVEAIFSEEELPAGQEQFKQLNAELAKQWPVITEKKDPPADAEAVSHRLMVRAGLIRQLGISNATPRQLAVYAAFDAAPPTYAHLPMVLGPDRKKLSKRHGAISVEEFRDACLKRVPAPELRHREPA